MKLKWKYSKLLAIVLCTFFLYACTSKSVPQTQINSDSQETVVDNEINIEDDQNTSINISNLITYDTNDYYSNWVDENPNFITLINDGANIDGQGVEIDNTVITINTSGTYVFSGEMDNGQIIVDVEDEGVVKLVLNGVNINNDNNSPIYVKKAKKIILSLQEGTENIISDGESYNLTNGEDEPNAAIFSKEDLTINGKGKLIVYGNYNNGITSKDDLKIMEGSIVVKSIDDGLMGRDLVVINNGDIQVDAGGDGIKSTNDTDATKGYIAIEGGNINIKAQSDGIQAETSILITEGIFDIISGGGSKDSYTIVEEKRKDPWANFENVEGNTEGIITESSKGIKVTEDITITAGVFKIDASDDALHSNKSINIIDGNFEIASGDDGFHADSAITIDGGDVSITKSYEGIESSLITINDGNINILSSDDGINVAGGNDALTVNGRFGADKFSSTEDNKLIINGGNVFVDATGDGLDANGSIEMTGGTVIVNGPISNGNGALDYDQTFEISGGVIVAAGSSGMVQAPSENAKQSTIIMNYSTLQQAGTLVHLGTAEGEEILTFSPNKEYQSIVISSPDIILGDAYVLYSGGSYTGSSFNGQLTGGKYTEGNKIIEFETSKVVTWLTETGETTGIDFRTGHPNRGGKGMGRPEPVR